ncbi:MAG: hypothetical protein KA763_00440 [Xanthomonadales bacterium]|nr:hypothetical protein [Xanthomonadales bacterium]
MRKQKTAFVAVKGDDVRWWTVSVTAREARKSATEFAMSAAIFHALETTDRRWQWLYRRGVRIKPVKCEVML